MRQTILSFIIIIFLLAAVKADSQNTTAYPGIPRIDVHSHISNNAEGMANYLKMRELLKQKYGCDLAMWINLGSGRVPFPDQQLAMDAGDGRIVCCISDFSPHDGFDIDPNELASWMEKGYVGYKIWAGPPHRFCRDDHAHGSGCGAHHGALT